MIINVFSWSLMMSKKMAVVMNCGKSLQIEVNALLEHLKWFMQLGTVY